MVLYECERCGKFKTEIKTHYLRHLRRKNICKPSKNNISTETLLEQIINKKYNKLPQNAPKKGVYCPKLPQNAPNDDFIAQNCPKMPQKKGYIQYTKNEYICKYCQKPFNRSYHLKRHEGSCRERKIENNVQNNLLDFFKEQMAEMKEAHQKDREAWQKEKIEMRKEIENLLERVGNVTNTINIKEQNIILNNYGHENLDYISRNYMNNLLKIPFGALPKLLKHIHFNPKHPENHNVKITNKKLPYASVWEGNKWTVKDKKQVIDNMVDKGYNLIDDQFTTEEEVLEENQKKKYKNFRNLYDNPDKKLQKTLRKDTELMILNYSKEKEKI